MDSKDWGPNTVTCHLGEERKVLGAVSPPLFLNSLFLFDDIGEMTFGDSEVSTGPPYYYSRVTNPTLEIAEAKIARLEGGEGCRLMGSGMAAISSAIMSAVSGGSHVVAVDTLYGPARTFLSDYMSRFGVETTYDPGTDTEAFLARIKDNTTLVYLESPSSLLFRLQDLRTISAECRRRGITTVIDNTCATPYFQKPIELGVDLVVHSASKYLGGHSDIVGGAIIGSSKRLADITKQEISLFGGVMAPFPAWLVNRALRTMHLRIERHQQSANVIANWLESDPRIARVHHTSLASHPQADLVARQMSGSGGLFSFEPRCQDKGKLHRFINSLELFGRGVSWGGFESLALAIEVKPMDYDKAKFVIRLFIGLEDVEDLQRDLSQALDIAGL